MSELRSGALVMSSDFLVVKASGDLTGASSDKFKADLLEAVRSSSSGLVVDLARPSAIDGRALVSLLMARRSAAACGKSFDVKLEHPEWREFPVLSGLADVIAS